MATAVITVEPDKEKPLPKAGSGMSRLVVWLVVFSMGFLLGPLYLSATIIEEANTALSAELDTIEQLLAVTPEPNPTETALRDNLMRLEEDKDTLQARVTQLETDFFNWPTLMSAIRAYDNSQIQLLGLVQANTRLTLTGHAGDEALVTTYVESLRASGHFNEVVIQSITLKSPVQSRNAATATDGASEAPEKYVEFVLSAEIQVGQP